MSATPVRPSSSRKRTKSPQQARPTPSSRKRARSPPPPVNGDASSSQKKRQVTDDDRKKFKQWATDLVRTSEQCIRIEYSKVCPPSYADFSQQPRACVPSRIPIADASIISIDVVKYSMLFYRRVELPETIGCCDQLKILSVSAKDPYTCPDFALSGLHRVAPLPCLEQLRLVDLRMRILSPEIGFLRRLRVLDLRRSSFTSLPDAICDLDSLETLDLLCGKLRRLPAHIGRMRSLTTLAAPGNRITCLPTSIGYLSSLTMLDVAHNSIRRLPDTFGNLAKL